MATGIDRKNEDKIRVLELLLRRESAHVTDAELASLLRPPSYSHLSTMLDAEALGLGVLCGRSLLLQPGSPVFAGGGGVVFQCEEKDIPGVRYALKVARPSLFRKRGPLAEAEYEKVQTEYRRHTPLAHPNIARMMGTGQLEWREGRASTVNLPCVLLEWVDGAKPLGTYLQERVADDPNILIDVVTQACSALAHLHSAGWIHWDIKSDNLLVSSSGQVKLMDLGNTHLVSSAQDRYSRSSIRETSLLNLPPALLECCQDVDDPEASHNRMEVTLPAGSRSWDRPFLDLYMFMRDLNRNVDLVPKHRALDEHPKLAGHTASPPVRFQMDALSEDDRFTIRYVATIVARVLEHAGVDEPHYYETAEEVVDAMSRLRPEYGGATAIEELRSVPQRVKRIPPGDNVPWTRRVDAIMNSSPLRRLKLHRQLATVHHVFSGAEHPRWEHSVGTYGEAIRYIRALYSDRGSILFRLETSGEDVTAVLLAALLHDLGHPAFGHQFEEIGILPDEAHHDSYAQQVLRTMAGEIPEAPYPPLSCDLISSDEAELWPIIRDEWCGGDERTALSLVRRCADILEGNSSDSARDGESTLDLSDILVSRSLVQRAHLDALHSIIAGELDADKADYLRRDGHHCGVEYANGIDRLRLEQTLTVVISPESAQVGGPLASIGINSKGVLPLESLIVARYQMFRAIYWNKTVRALTAMLQFMVESYILREARVTRRTVLDRARLDEVVTRFRVMKDTDALEWLASQLNDPAFGALRSGLLGERSAMYWTVAELYGFPENGRGHTIGSREPGGRSVGQLYEDLLARWSPTVTKSALDVALARQKLRDDLIREVIKALGGPRRSPLREPGSILLDVPRAGKDQVENLFVASDWGVEPERLEDLTPLADAVAEAFRRSVRRVRVLMRPDVARALSADIGESALEDLMRLALTSTLSRHG